MILETGNKIHESFLRKCVKYVNEGWHMEYKVQDVAGIELSETYMFVHFNKEDYTKEAYPVNARIEFF